MTLSKMWELINDPAPKPCMKSGFCCTKAPCVYGSWNRDHTACEYLQAPDTIGQRLCGRYDWIKANVPDWEMYPAFGAGCCMPLFNDMRDNIIKKNAENK